MRKKLFSFFFLFASLAFTAELPYPIIFVHGINNNAQMWEETELIQVYFDIYSMTYQQIDITLDYNINYNSPHDPYEDDVHMFTVVEPNGYYLINFDVDYSGTRIGLEKNNKLNLQDYINDSETTFEIQVPGSGDDMYGRLSNYLRIGDVIRIGNEYMKTEEFISWDGVFDQVTISVLRGLYDSSIESHGITQDIYVVSNQSNQSSIMKQGYGLLQAINAVKVANNAEKVILVGHSMGGLAARMYVQYFYQEDVAKLVTIGTPNLGAVKNDVYGDDIIDWTSYFFETGIDEKSEAVRDLAYHYNSELSINPTAPGIQSESDNGVFLFGGDENSIPDNLFINKDVNADGDENDNDIVGLNNMVFPNDFEYYFFTGKTRDETMRIDADNDGVVLTDRQWLDLGSGEYTGGPLVWYRTDPPIEAWHSAALVEWLGDFEIFAEGYEVQETIEIIKSLDEPDEPTIAWGVETDKFYRGIATHQSTTMLDYDWYKFDLMGDGYVSLYYYPPYGVSGRIDFYTDIPVNPNENSEYNYIYVENNQSFNYQPDILLNSNTYYFRVRNTVENTDAWSDNYSFEISAHFVNVYSSFTATPTSGYAPLTVQFTDLSYAENTEITTWEWHFGDGQTSFEQNPEHTYTNSGTYTVTLMVGDGTYYATEAEPNYITIYTEDPPQSDTDITAVEYFFDDDPGVGGGISIPISQGNVVNIQTNISISSLSVGLHRLYVRARDEDGIWGIAQGKPVLVQSTGPDDPLPNITDVEYFFDDDPGVGGGTDLSLSPSTEVDISSNISISSLSVGLHRLYVRARDEDGIWGIAQGKPVLVQSTGPDDPLPNIVDIEYFFNSDPGFGNAESFEFTPSDTVNIDSNLSLAELDLGEHLLYVRAMDETGIWGIAQYHEFTVEELEPPIITEIPNLFFNEDESTQISLNNYVTDEDTDINDLFWSTYFPNDLEFSSTVFQNDMLKIDNFKKTVKPTKLEISNLNKLFNSLKKNKFVQPKLNEMKVTQNRDISDSVFILINSETQIATISAYENFNQLNIPVVFRVTDQYGLFDEDTSTISIYPVNDAPSIEDLNIELDEDTTVEIEFIGSDIEGDELSYIIYEEPIHGNVVGNIYTPNQDYYGSDSLFYIANDGELDSEPATVTITVNTVNDTPIADDISVTTDEDVSVAITMTGSDADGDDLTFSVVSAPVNGTYDGTTYTPNTGWFGVDSFTYVANDGELDSEIATVTINVILITVTLNKDLSVGWNWFSINIENDDMSLDNVFYSLGENATLIKNQTGFATYYADFGWYGLDAIDVTSMYMIMMTTSADLVFEGTAVDFVNTPISLSTGWNWIGYLPQTPNNLDNALSSIGENAALIKNQTEFATYYEGFGWYGMDSLNPSDGYMINIVASAELVYGVPDGLVRIDDKVDVDYHWTVDYRAFEHNMTITAVVEIDGIQMSEEDQLGVFVNGECRGTAVPTYFPLTDSYTANLIVYGNDGEELSFRVYQKANDTELEIFDHLTFEVNGIIGNDIEPVLLSKITTPEEYSLSQNYPNPFNPSTTISYQLPAPGSVLLAIYNVTGQLVETMVNEQVEAGYHQITWDADNQPSGLYFVRMTAGDFVRTQKMLLLK